jgi:hypothetical protein
MWGGRGGREHPPLTHIQSNACRFLFLLFTYLRFAEAASFDKKELCRRDTTIKQSKSEEKLTRPRSSLGSKQDTYILIYSIIFLILKGNFLIVPNFYQFGTFFFAAGSKIFEVFL